MTAGSSGTHLQTAAAATDGATELQSTPMLCRWTSKRISAVEGSHIVLARYSQKSSASQDDEATGLLYDVFWVDPWIGSGWVTNNWPTDNFYYFKYTRQFYVQALKPTMQNIVHYY